MPRTTKDFIFSGILTIIILMGLGFQCSCQTQKQKASSIADKLGCEWSEEYKFCACVYRSETSYAGFGFAAPDHSCGK